MNLGKVLLILGGGGVRGLAHIGVLKVLERLGVSISEYAGTSVGAIVAAMAASGMKAGEIEKIGLSLRQSDLFDFNYTGLLTNPGRIKGLCKGENLRQFIKRVIPVDRFSHLQKPLFLGAVNIGNGEMIFWGMNQDQALPLHDAIYASCAIPGIFPPQKIGEAFYVDGGVVDSLPLQLARIRKPDLIIAVNLGPLNPMNGNEIQENGIFSIMERFYEIKSREMLECRRCSEAETPLILIEPDVGDHRFFKVHRRRELIQKGETEADAVLKSHALRNKEKARRYVGIDERSSPAAPSLSLTVWGNEERRCVMQCPRCRGLMIDERFCALDEDIEKQCFEGWRCILCGEILDPIILTNRATFGSSLVSYAACGPKHGID